MTIPYCVQLAGRFGFSVAPMNPPPSEKGSKVIQFSLTEGCSHAVCTFCEMYGSRDSYRVKSLEEFKEHVDRVLGHLMQDGEPAYIRKLIQRITGAKFQRIFIGAGNALSVETGTLMEATQYALEQVKRFTGPIPRRLALYGNIDDILKKEYDGLKYLRCGGFCGNCSADRLGERRGVEVVYLGLESGNSEILRLAGKGYGLSDAINALSLLNLTRIRASVMVIPGLGGIEHSDAHIKDTLHVLNDGRAEWVTFIGLKIGENTPYGRWIKKEEEKGTNRRLTPAEIVEQTARMIEGLKIRTTVGVHGDDIHTFGHNPVAIGTNKIEGGIDAGRVAHMLRTKAVKQGLEAYL